MEHTVFQPDYTDCANCGTVDHNDYDCPCGCHGDDSPSRRRMARLESERALSAGPVDVGTITEYGLTQRLSLNVRCF